MSEAMVSIVLLADRTAYEGGRIVGQIVGYALIGCVVLWVLGKVFRR